MNSNDAEGRDVQHCPELFILPPEAAGPTHHQLPARHGEYRQPPDNPNSNRRFNQTRRGAGRIDRHRWLITA